MTIGCRSIQQPSCQARKPDLHHRENRRKHPPTWFLNGNYGDNWSSSWQRIGPDMQPNSLSHRCRRTALQRRKTHGITAERKSGAPDPQTSSNRSFWQNPILQSEKSPHRWHAIQFPPSGALELESHRSSFLPHQQF